MNEKVLFVDDDINLLSAIKRFLRNDLKFETTLSGQKGLEIIADEGPFAVVVADMRMPGMDGVEFLRRVKNDNPDTVRIMLTGNADMQTAIKAVNEGNIFRFLTKPTSKETLIKAINAGIFQYKLQIAERELLEKTLHGSINTLTEILSVVNPVAFAKTQRIKKFIHHMAEHLEFDNIWQFEIAAMLSQIGCVTIPTEILEKELAGEKLTDIEKNMLESHPITAAKLLSNIPRIETIAEIIKNQNTPPELTSPPPANRKEWGSNIMYAALEFDKLLISGMSFDRSLNCLKKKEVNQLIIEALSTSKNKYSGKQLIIQDIMANKLISGMIIDDDIRTCSGVLVAPKGIEVTFPILKRIKNFSKGVGIHEPIRVMYTETIK